MGGGTVRLGPLAGAAPADATRPAVVDDEDDGQFTMPVAVSGLTDGAGTASLGKTRAPTLSGEGSKTDPPARATVTRRFTPPVISAPASPPGPLSPTARIHPDLPVAPVGDKDGTQRLRRLEGLATAAEPLKPPVSQVPAVDPSDPRIKGWLVCEPFRPVPVGTRTVLTIGRAPECDFVLPHSGVSRTHAVVRVAGADLVFEDRSSYGSYRNGERVLTAKLAFGDSILIGPYELRLRSVHELRGPTPDGGEETRPLGSMRTLPTAEVMSGRVEKQPLAEVLQSVEFNQKTGTLEVFTDDGGTAQLVTYEGRPMFATFGALKDNDAVYAMVALKRGYFSFRSKIEAGEQTLKGTITSLLLEASRRIDDSSQR